MTFMFYSYLSIVVYFMALYVYSIRFLGVRFHLKHILSVGLMPFYVLFVFVIYLIEIFVEMTDEFITDLKQ